MDYKYETYARLIDFFGKGISDGELNPVPFGELNARAVRLGWVIHPDCCNDATVCWLNTLTVDYNATFYKEWNDVVLKSRFGLFVDQLLHYATTYGTDFSLGNGYVPNDGSVTPSFRELKVLSPITRGELLGECLKTLSSGVALKESTCGAMCDFIVHHAKELPDGFVDSVANREAQARLCAKLKRFPSDPVAMLRTLMFMVTGSTLIIKGKAELDRIKALSAAQFEPDSTPMKHPLLLLGSTELRALSSIFHRFKPIFLAMKTKSTAHTVNRLRRLAKENHRPFRTGFFENIVSVKRPIEEVCRRLADLDNFRKVRLLNIIRERISFVGGDGVFVIRNGKMFVRKDYAPKYDLEYLGNLYLAVKASLVNSLSAKACKVYVPKGLDLALPTSEKNFVGPFPFGSSFEMGENNIIGVYWRNEWGTRDFDLSVTDIKGVHISWCANFKTNDNGIIYSGDMTNAEPEAVELLYAKGTMPDSVIWLNKFSGSDISKFRFFYARERLDPESMYNHMVDPNSVKLDAMVPFEGQGQKCIGLVADGRFYFMDLGSGGKRVASPGPYVESMIGAMKRRLKSYEPMKDVLTKAGFTFVDDAKDADIDLSSAATIVSLLSKEG